MSSFINCRSVRVPTVSLHDLCLCKVKWFFTSVRGPLFVGRYLLESLHRIPCTGRFFRTESCKIKQIKRIFKRNRSKRGRTFVKVVLCQLCCVLVHLFFFFQGGLSFNWQRETLRFSFVWMDCKITEIFHHSSPFLVLPLKYGPCL